jgi:hypothetical protein
MNELYYNKYLKYRHKFYHLKLQQSIQKGGSYQPTFFIYSVYDRHTDFINEMKSLLIERGWKESSVFPVDFMFLYFSYKIEPPILDTNQSKLVNLIKGNTFNNILDNELFIRKYKYEYFMYPYKIIDVNDIITIDKKYALFPIYNKFINRNYVKKIVSSKEDIQEYIKLYPEMNKWMLRDILNEPVLKNGYIFNLNFIFIIKLNPFKVFAIKKKQYIKSKLMYDPKAININPYIFDTFKDEFDKNEVPLFFPDDLPDGWDEKETNEMNDMIENSIQLLFSDKIDIEPDNNSKNGYFIFNSFIRLYERLPPIIYYVLNTFSPHLHKHIVPALVSILIDNKDHPDFKQIKLGKKLKHPIINNFEYIRYYSLSRTVIKTLNRPITERTYYLNMAEDSFESDISNYLITQGYIKSSTFPVDFILLSGDSLYYRNRFDSRGSNWISLLYGNSKTEITNKILLHKEYDKSEFMINSIYLIQSQLIPNVNESTIKILKPLNGFAGSGITIVKTKEDIKLWLSKNEKYKEWILEDYIVDPDLKDGYKFHFRILILVKVEQNNPIEVFISEYKFYTVAKEKYKKGDWQNKNIHDTHYTPGKIMTFPDNTPDNWTIDDSNKAILDMNNIFIKIFKNRHDFKPEWNAKNGFEIFGADIMFSNKKPYLLEINAKTGLKDTNIIIPGLVQTILENKENEYFTKLI